MNKTKITMKQNFKITIMFDGSNFFGWAKQTKERTVQGEITKILKDSLAEDIKIIGCSRTDKGVHSKFYVFNFLTNRKITILKLKKLLINLLPPDISLSNCELVDNDFHARFSAKEKTYHYLIKKEKPSVFEQRYYAYFNNEKLNVALIKDALKLFIGKYNFTSFSAYNKSVDDMICTISEFDFIEKNDHYYFTITGNRFLKYMVRIIVANLINIGLEKTTRKNLEKILVSYNRNISGAIAPGNGLYLDKVYY